MHLVVCSPIPALRAGLYALICADPDLAVAAVGASISELEPVAPEVSILVATSGAISAAEAPPSGFAVLLVSDLVDEALALAAQNLRVWGVISPDAPADTLQAAVRALAEGLVVVSPDLYQRMRSQPASLSSTEKGGMGEEPAERLTAREVEILGCLAQGLTNKQAALALQISEHTVKFHVSAIYAKLGVSNRAEAVSKGARAGLVAL